MKKFFILTLLVCVISNLVAQEQKPNKAKLVPFILQKDSVKGFQIYVDSTNQLQFIVILDSINMPQDDIYNKLVTYFTPTVEEPFSSIDVKDRTAGQIMGKKFLKEYSKSNFEFLNANVKTTNYYSFNTYLNYRVDIKSNRVRLKFTIQRINATVIQVPMSAAKLDYTKLVGRSAPLELLPINVTPKPEERYKNSINTGNNTAETKAFDDLTKKCLTTVDDVRRLMYKIVGNKANTNDW